MTARVQGGDGRVLVAEDDASLATVLSILLKDAGYQVTACGDGPSALAAAADPPGVVLLNVRMPGLDGIEVCRRLKADPRTREVPVIFVTAEAPTDPVAQLDGAPYEDILSKPYEADALLTLVRRYLD